MKTVVSTNGSFLHQVLRKASKQIAAIRVASDRKLVPLPASQEVFLLLFFAYFLTSDQARAIDLVKGVRPDLEFVINTISQRCFDHWFFEIVKTYAKDYEQKLDHLNQLPLKKQRFLVDELRAREAILLVDLQKLAKQMQPELNTEEK